MLILWLTDQSVGHKISVHITKKNISYIYLVLPHFSSKSGLNTWPSQWIPFSKKKYSNSKYMVKIRISEFSTKNIFAPLPFIISGELILRKPYNY